VVWLRHATDAVGVQARQAEVLGGLVAVAELAETLEHEVVVLVRPGHPLGLDVEGPQQRELTG
jgi:hypothetical protein